MEEKNYIIYCDADGVLVDFDLGYFKLTGINISTHGYIDKKKFKQLYGFDFWPSLDKVGAKFWSELPWIEDGKLLWDYIKMYNPIILSSPSSHPSSRVGKKEWFDRELPLTQLILAYSHSKHVYATPNSILIDDRVSNIEEWKKSGGIGILYTSLDSTLKELKKLGL